MDFKSSVELLELCRQTQCPISEVMRRGSASWGRPPGSGGPPHGQSAGDHAGLRHTAAEKAVQVHGRAHRRRIQKLYDHAARGKAICGDILQRAMTYAMGVAEVNASMGLIVAAPTAGSAGIVPGLLLALQDCYKISDDRLVDALFNAGAVGYLAMRNATVAGAVGGCQAEVGVAAAMAASATVELMGGTPEQCMDAGSTVLMNLLGLVCDPVGGLVEYPCQNRNAAGVANALIAAELSLSGVKQLIPFDEMLETMYAVGRRIPIELRETALGGCAATPSACARCSGGCG